MTERRSPKRNFYPILDTVCFRGFYILILQLFEHCLTTNQPLHLERRRLPPILQEPPPVDLPAAYVDIVPGARSTD